MWDWGSRDIPVATIRAVSAQGACAVLRIGTAVIAVVVIGPTACLRAHDDHISGATIRAVRAQHAIAVFRAGSTVIAEVVVRPDARVGAIDNWLRIDILQR